MKTVLRFALPLLLLTGCRLDGTSLRMDSDSRVPFLGFQLSQTSPDDSSMPVRYVPAAVGTQHNADVRFADQPPSAPSFQWRNLFGTRRIPKRIPLSATVRSDHPGDHAIDNASTVPAL